MPVFRMRVVEVCLPTLTCCGQSVRKSMTHEHSEEPRPRLYSLQTGVYPGGMMDLMCDILKALHDYQC